MSDEVRELPVLVIYDQHDMRFPLYSSDGNRFEGCMGCGRSRDEIEASNLPCRRWLLKGIPLDDQGFDNGNHAREPEVVALEKIEVTISYVDGSLVIRWGKGAIKKRPKSMRGGRKFRIKP